ncbi:hypothetical protein [Paenibacillus tyrfis]|uniref:hypothetical protein n=1 Tax=Paenibacillus tyrfis TaxID=1501230 RepID=UPI00209FCFDF|nr:hypothetical protein [Paenibacillus tyrfis]MCP1312424.1 hypothetical protein [Paenibacillus tyrfis]
MRSRVKFESHDPMPLLNERCWDAVEVSQLAIGNMIGEDIDPETGNEIVYWQIINPAAL